eukprot:TRINITY_DN2610_c0_g1_i4.p1 TRINITY_DN2610_c0_g1~~TRINITY_DN2610_c0_g1_i4.p1  ORF type:complete len:119 (+),score=28.89 TRINITY_DN2610_c0_g1_i4:213-569(+)
MAYSLKVTVHKGEKLIGKDDGGKSSDPYVRMTVGKKKFETTEKKKTLNPVWDESFTFAGVTPGTKLDIDIFDRDFMVDDAMGGFLVDLDKEFSAGATVTKFFDVKHGTGRLELTLAKC